MQVYLGTLFTVMVIAAFSDLKEKSSANQSRDVRTFGVAGFLTFLILALVSSLRWGVGTDYWTYYRNFDDYVEEASKGLRLFGGEGIGIWEEPGIRFISLAANSVGGDAITMFAIAAVITLFLAVRTIWKTSPNILFAIAIFILSGSWYGSFNVVRQYIAAAILLAGHKYVLERKPLKWILVVFLASLFHFSAWIGIFFYFIPRRPVSFIRQIVFILIALAISLASGELLNFISIIQDGADLSRNATAVTEVNELRVLFALVPIVIFWLLPKPQSLNDSKSWFYVNVLLVYGAMMLSMSASALLTRFVIYPQIFLAIALSFVTDYEDRFTRIVVRSFLFILFLIFMIVEVNGSDSLLNFHWAFERT